MAEDVATTVAALEDERYAAMLSGDTGKLDRLLDDRLCYVHSSGRVDNKASYLGGFGRLWQHRSIDRQGQTSVTPIRAGDLGDDGGSRHSKQKPAKSGRAIHLRPSRAQRTVRRTFR